MEKYIEVMVKAGPAAYIVIALFVALLIWWGYRVLKGSSASPKPKNKQVSSRLPKVSETAIEGSQPIGLLLHKGNINCLCFHKIKGVMVVDFTTIEEPMGEMHQFDPSCPRNGIGYTLKEDEKGNIVDYDPREVKVEISETPDFAWHAINWRDDVNGFWVVPTKWWTNIANWYAAGVLALVFFGILVVLG